MARLGQEVMVAWWWGRRKGNGKGVSVAVGGNGWKVVKETWFSTGMGARVGQGVRAREGMVGECVRM